MEETNKVHGRTGKRLYDIYIILPTTSFHFYRYAYSRKQALERGVNEIAKKQGVLKALVWGYINDNPGRYTVEEAKGGIT
jgi:hypothetical protein